jgi:hypothetical protein
MGSERPGGGASHGAPEPRYEITVAPSITASDEKRGWKRDAERLSDLEVERQKNVRRLQYWQVGGRLAAENPTGVDARLAIPVKSIRDVGHKTAGFKKEAA